MKWTDKYIGIPYKELGRDRSGIDCYGLCLLVYKNELGIKIPDYFGIGYEKNKDELRGELQKFIVQESKKNWVEVNLTEGKPFDLILFRIAGYVIHIGILVDSNIMLHSFNGMDCVLEKLDIKCRNRIYKVIRWVA